MAGRPNKYESNVLPHLKDIKQWIKEGVTDKEISKRLNINQKVLCKYKNEFKELNELYLNTKKEIPLIETEKKWCVYKHTFPNGKIYIGITCQNPKVRWANGKGYGKNTFVRAAIDKYGWENVEHEILFENLTEKEAKSKEVELIGEYKSYSPNQGYNLTKGGEGTNRTKEQIRLQKLRQASFGSIMLAESIEDVLDNLELVQKLSKEGLSKEEIANVCGVSRSTWYNWEQINPTIKEAVDLGRIEAVKAIKAALFKRAIGFSYNEKKVITKKIVIDGGDEESIPAEVVQTEEYTKYSVPDPTAALMLLKHWDTDQEWTSDPATLKLKKQEYELKKKHMESEEW